MVLSVLSVAWEWGLWGKAAVSWAHVYLTALTVGPLAWGISDTARQLVWLWPIRSTQQVLRATMPSPILGTYLLCDIKLLMNNSRIIPTAG